MPTMDRIALCPILKASCKCGLFTFVLLYAAVPVLHSMSNSNQLYSHQSTGGAIPHEMNHTS